MTTVTLTVLTAPGASARSNSHFSVAAATATATAKAKAKATVALAQPAGTFTPLRPARVLDTRSGFGAAGPVRAGGSVSFRVLGRGGVPSAGVSAVVLTITATQSGGPGYLTVHPDGTARPVASNLNFVAGRNVANMVIVPVGANGNVRVANGAGRSSVQVIGDVAGYFTAGVPVAAGSFHPLPITRVSDTRSGPGAAPLPAWTSRVVRVTGLAGVPSSGVGAVVVNLTATQSGKPGYLTVTANGTPRPSVSSLNFATGATVANLAVIPVGADGRLNVFNGSAGTVHVMTDVLGYYQAGNATALGAFHPVAQQRVLDSRSGVGGLGGPLAENSAISLRVLDTAGVPASSVSAVVLNLTAASPPSAGYLTAYPNNTARPNASNLNFAAGQTVAALATVPVGNDGSIRLYNGGGSTPVVADIVGYYVSTALPCDRVPADPSGSTVTRWDPVVRCVLGMLGVAQSASNVADVDTVIRYESSGDPNAINNWDSNAQAGHPSKGLVQVIQPTFDYYRSRALPADLYNPAANVYAGMNYAISNYGSIHNIPGLVSLRNGGGYRGYIIRK